MKALADFKVLLDRTMRAENEAYGSTQFTPLDVRAALAASVEEAARVLETELRPGDHGAKGKVRQGSFPKGRVLKRNELHQACSSGDLDRVKACVETVDINERSLDGFTPLFLAVKANHADVAQFLLEAGADHALLSGTHGIPTLHQAVKDKNIAMVKLLIRNGADRDLEDLAGTTVFEMQLSIPMWSALKNTPGPCDKFKPPSTQGKASAPLSARPQAAVASASVTPRTPAHPKRASDGGGQGNAAAPAKRKTTSPTKQTGDVTQARKLFKTESNGGNSNSSSSSSGGGGGGGGGAGVIVPDFDITTEFFLGKSANEYAVAFDPFSLL